MRGNRAVVAAVQENYGVTVVDVSNPATLANKRSSMACSLNSARPQRLRLAAQRHQARRRCQAARQRPAVRAGDLRVGIPQTWALTSKKEFAG